MSKIYEITNNYRLVREDEQPDTRLNNADDIVAYMAGAFDDYPQQEQFWVVFLNRKNRAIGRQRISIGTLTATCAHPREVFRAAILAGDAAIACVHNHPSGDPSPGTADNVTTRILREAGRLLDIEMIDHVIIGEKYHDPSGTGYFSSRSAGLC